MRRSAAHIFAGALLIALVAAGTPLAQTLRVERTLATAEKRAETRLLLPSEWSGAGQAAETRTSTGTEKHALPPQLLKPVSEQWDSVRALQAPVADLPPAPELPVQVQTVVPAQSELGAWLPNIDPPDIRLRGPPTQA